MRYGLFGAVVLCEPVNELDETKCEQNGATVTLTQTIQTRAPIETNAWTLSIILNHFLHTSNGWPTQLVLKFVKFFAHLFLARFDVIAVDLNVISGRHRIESHIHVYK